MKPITQGNDWNFFQEVVVLDGYESYREDSDVTYNVRFLNSFSLLNLGTATVYYSFNGWKDHGSMIPGTPCQGLVFDNRAISGGIWFYSAAPIQVRVEAWCNS